MHKLWSLLAWRTVDSFRVPCGLRSREPHLRRIAPTLTGLGERDDEAQELLAVMLLDADVARGEGVRRIAVLESELPSVCGIPGPGNRRRGRRVVENHEDHELVLPFGAVGGEQDASVGEDRTHAAGDCPARHEQRSDGTCGRASVLLPRG